MSNDFAGQLRTWRQKRRLSQLALAVESGVSARHLSFMENGHSRPSREMVLRLATELRLPLREQNHFLLAAGFAPVFEERPLSAAPITAVRAAAELVLARHDPFPAVALDRQRNVVLANRAATALSADAEASLGRPINLYRLLLHPAGLAPRIIGFEAYSAHLLRRLAHDAETSGDPLLRALHDEASAYPNVGRATEPSSDPSLTFRLRDVDGELAFISTLATFGTPFDVTVSELLIECLFAADERTAQVMRARSI